MILDKKISVFIFVFLALIIGGFASSQSLDIWYVNLVKSDLNPPGVKGDTVSGATKPAELETGVTIQVPLFVNEGEVVKVDTRDESYVGRAK